MTSILDQETLLSSEEIMKKIKAIQKQEDGLWYDYRSALLREQKEKK
jgi:hypothetical protein